MSYVLTADRIITEKEFKKLFRSAREKVDALHTSNDPLLVKWINPYFLIGIGYYTGLRISEVSGLRWSDLHLEDQCLIVRNGKGGKSRTVHFGELVVGLFQELQTLQSKHYGWTLDHKEGFVFVSPKNRRRLKRGGIHLHFKSMAKLAGLREDLSFHSLRHGGLTRMVNLGIPLHVVKEQAGHVNLNTTAIYLHFTEDTKKKLAKIC